MSALLGQLVLAIHVAVIAFNIFGLVAVPLGKRRGWAWVLGWRWRAAHLASLALVAVQAVLGRACFLTDWQQALTGAGETEPLIMRWVNSLIYWELPMWAFAVAYVAVFAYALWLWQWARPTRQSSKA